MKEFDAVEVAKQQRHLYLLRRVKEQKKLSAADVAELAEYEAMVKAKKKNNQSAGGIIGDVITSQKAAAEFANVTERTIRNWVNKDGMPQVDLAGGRKGYSRAVLAGFKRMHAQDNTKAQLHAQEIEYKKAKTALVEMEVKVRTGELISAADVNRMLAERISAVLSGLRVLKRKLLARMKGRPYHRWAKIIQEEIDYLVDVFAGDVDPSAKSKKIKKKPKRKKATRKRKR